MKAMAISRSGMDVEWRRLQVIAENLANLDTTRTASGSPFRPMRLVSGPKGGFSALIGKSVGSSSVADGVEVLGIEAMPGGTRRVYEPHHPHADPDGFVTYPNVDRAGEMTLMIQASRSYEANLVALNMAHQMYVRALDLGKQS